MSIRRAPSFAETGAARLDSSWLFMLTVAVGTAIWSSLALPGIAVVEVKANVRIDAVPATPSLFAAATWTSVMVALAMLAAVIVLAAILTPDPAVPPVTEASVGTRWSDKRASLPMQTVELELPVGIWAIGTLVEPSRLA